MDAVKAIVVEAASVVTAIAALAGAIVIIYKAHAANQRQTEVIRGMQDELTLVCFALKSVLDSMVQAGADGPCHEALDKLNKYLNQTAHKVDI